MFSRRTSPEQIHVDRSLYVIVLPEGVPEVERELDSLSLELAKDVEIQLLAEGAKFPYIGRCVPVHELDAECPRSEILEKDPGRTIRIHAFVIVQCIANDRDGLLHLLARCIQWNVNLTDPADVLPTPDILDVVYRQ